MRAALVMLMLLPVVGCGRPHAANIELRRENQRLTERVAELEAKLRAARETGRIEVAGVGGVGGVAGGVDVARLFTTDRLRIGRLTGVREERLTVHVVPLDRTGDELKAAGGFTIEAFDLARGADALVGQWTFTPEQAAAAWVGSAFQYNYVLVCPLPGPVTRELSLRVVFRELLTGRTFETTARAPVLPR